MKKLILAVTVAAFTVAAHAGGEGCADKDKAACAAGKDKAASTAAKVNAKQAKAEGKSAGCCPAAKEVKQALASPKAAKN